MNYGEWIMNDMGSLLKDRVAIVTGAGSGIGKSIALQLAQNGCRVMLAGRNVDNLDSVSTEIEDGDGDAVCCVCDVTNEASVVNLVRTTVNAFGRLDIVVNNAGVGIYGMLEDSQTSDWEAVMNVNARGPYLLCREAVPYLRERSISYIVNVGSVVSVKGYERQSIYSASKHAMHGLSKALAREVQEDNIRVHVICPGGVDTDMVSQARPDLDRSDLIQPDEIADIVLFLVTRRGKAVIDEVCVRRAASTPWA